MELVQKPSVPVLFSSVFIKVPFTLAKIINPFNPRLQRIRFLFYRHRIFITRSGWRQRQLRHKAQHPFENVIAVR